MNSHPKGLYVLLSVELWERFSYYGMRALLMLYMVHELGFDSRTAGLVYGLYTALAYLTPVVGGIWADRVVGQRRAIAVGSVLMAFGHFVMMFAYLPLFYVALALVVIGTGLFKANTAALVGQLYPEADERKRDTGFGLFYLTVNLGAFLAPLVCGTLAQRGQWHLGFGAAGFGMLVGLFIFMRWQAVLGDVGMRPEPKVATDEPARRLSPKERHRIWALVMFALVGNVVLWGALSQNGSSMALFADRNTNLGLPLLNVTIPASFLQSANPLFIVLGVPLFAALWRILARHNKEPDSAQKFVVGLLLVSCAFLILVVAGQRADAGIKVSMGWLLLASFCATCGELCVSPVGLSLVSKLSPKRYASAMMGMWYASMALANWLGGTLAGMYDHMGKADLFSIPALATGLAGIAMMLLTPTMRRLMHGVR